MKIDTEWIKKWSPCQEALNWYKDYLGQDSKVILKRLIKHKKYDWANWFMVSLSGRMCSQYMAVG